MATSTPGASKRSTTTKRSDHRTQAGRRRHARQPPDQQHFADGLDARARQARSSARSSSPWARSLLAGDNLVSTVRGLATTYGTRTGLERELKRYEKRGATARNRFERKVRRARTRFERELRQRRSLVERTMRQNRRRLKREVRSVRRDLEKQSGTVSARVERLVANAQGLIGS